MKKTLVVLLILAVAGGVFAQELSWSGVVETGIGIGIDDGADDPIVTANNDDDVLGVRAKLNAAVEGEGWGLKIGTKAEYSNTNPEVLVIYNAYGWIDFIDGILNVKAGLIDDGVWNTGGDKDWNLSTGKGVRIEVKPIEGLNIGAFLNYGGRGFGGITAEQWFLETTLGASFTHELFDVAIAFKLDSDADVDQNNKDWFDPDWGEDSGSALTRDDKGARLIFGFAFKGVENLTLKAEVQATKLGDFSDNGVIFANETVEYQVMEPLAVGIVAAQSLGKYVSGTDTKSQVYLGFKPYVSYQVNEPLSVGLEVPFALMTNVAKDELGFAAFGAKPWVKYAVTENASVKASYAATFTTEDFGRGGDSDLDHAIQITFAYSF